MTSPSPQPRSIEPEFFGPLTDRPLAEGSSPGDPADLFAGASAFLRGRHARKRRDQWNLVRPIVDRMLRPDEHVLYVTHAMQVPPTLHVMAMGAMAFSYHQVVMVFTDTRLIEVLLSVRGTKAETRVRSFPWASVRALKMSMSKLSMAPAQGRKLAWRVPLRGDRRFLKLLLARLSPRLMQAGAAMAQPVPIWHCPKCAAAIAAKAKACGSCRTEFRTSRMAALLAMACPGAGLLYAGHPFLALGDFLGEVIFYALFVMLMIEADPASLKVAIGVGVVLFLLTKLESAHLSQILVARTKPETAPQRSRYHRLALVGGLTSLILIGGVFPLAGAARPVVDRDLDVEAGDGEWQGSRDTQEWDVFSDDATARSQWWHSSGARVTLFAYPQRLLDGVSEFRNEVRLSLSQQGLTIVSDDESVPSPFRGFRFIARGSTPEGEPLSVVHYFVVDERNRDIHQALGAQIAEDASGADEMVRDLLGHAHWIGASPPLRPAPGAPAPPSGL